MSDALQTIEQVLVTGDLSRFTAEQKITYYERLCESLGLNKLTKPFEYLSLQGKLVLYATKNCGEQLRQLHGVSITNLVGQRVEDVYIVTATAVDKHGRTDCATGAVSVANLKADALCNAFMKAETKSKRRVTLSLCSLGMLDETEIETIAGAVRANIALPVTNGTHKQIADNGAETAITNLKELCYWANNEFGDDIFPTEESVKQVLRDNGITVWNKNINVQQCMDMLTNEANLQTAGFGISGAVQ